MKNFDEDNSFSIRLLRRLISREHGSLSGDIEEAYQRKAAKNKTRAILWLFEQMIIIILHRFFNMLYWEFIMLKNYIKAALRNISRQKIVSLINMFGLAAGMTCCMLIMLWVYHELSYDSFHEKANAIYRVTKIWRKGEVGHYATSPAALAPALKEEYPEIREATRLQIFNNVLFHT